MRRFSVHVLIVCLLLAQSALLAHELDVTAHADGHACEYCALTGSLDKPVVGAAATVVATSDIAEVYHALVALLPVVTATFDARAPPAIS